MESEKFQKAKNADKARLDVAARGVWSTFEKTFVDDRKATLTDLLTNLNVTHCNLAHSWNNW